MEQTNEQKCTLIIQDHTHTCYRAPLSSPEACGLSEAAGGSWVKEVATERPCHAPILPEATVGCPCLLHGPGTGRQLG